MLTIDPLVEPPNARIDLPGSKSITNRALVVAGLADGESELAGVLFSEDTHVMMDSLQKMGVGIRQNLNGLSVSISGTGGSLERPEETLWVHQSGTTARFCLPLAALCRQEVTIDGDEQIKNRPHEELCKALQSLGAQIEYLEAPNSFPLVVNGKDLQGGQISLNGGISSQFISCLLYTSPSPRDRTRSRMPSSA